MDLKQEFEQLKQQLRDLGFNEEKLNELLGLASDETVDRALMDAQDMLDDAKLEELANSMDKPISTQEEAQERINMLFVALYGNEAENKKYLYLNEYLKETVELTKKSKDLMDRYAQGDPTAVASVQSHMGDPDAQEIQDKLEEN